MRKVSLCWDIHGGLDNRLATRPDLSICTVPVAWGDVQPGETRWNWNSVDAGIGALRARGKRVMLKVGLYGPRKLNMVPGWLLANKRVHTFSYATKDDGAVTLPVCWVPGRFQAAYELFCQRLAKRYAGKVDYVMLPLGHLGTMAADASQEGTAALAAVEWDTNKWAAWLRWAATRCAHEWGTTERMVCVSQLWTRDISGRQCTPHVLSVVQHLLDMRAGVGCILSGLDPDAAGLEGTPFDCCPSLLGCARFNGTLMLRDDWPLWVPPARRQGHEADRDDAGFVRELGTARDTFATVPLASPVLVVLRPEMEATTPGTPGYAPGPSVELAKFLGGN